MKPFKHMVRIPGPLIAEPRSLINEARQFVRVHDNNELLQRFRLVLKIDNGGWFIIDRAPDFVTITSEEIKADWALSVVDSSPPFAVELYGVLDENKSCLQLKPVNVVLLSCFTLWCNYHQTR